MRGNEERTSGEGKKDLYREKLVALPEEEQRKLHKVR
jgi:hypothetical protein